jgi:hypothetical protein
VGQGEVGQWVVGKTASGSGAVGQWVVGKRASGSQRKVGQWVAGESGTGRGRTAWRGSRGAARFARWSIPPEWVDLRVCQGKRGRRGEKDVRRCRPTLHGRARSRRGGGFERGVGPHCTDGPSLDREKGWCGRRGGPGVASEDTLPRCTEGHRLLSRRAGRGG